VPLTIFIIRFNGPDVICMRVSQKLLPCQKYRYLASATSIPPVVVYWGFPNVTSLSKLVLLFHYHYYTWLVMSWGYTELKPYQLSFSASGVRLYRYTIQSIVTAVPETLTISIPPWEPTVS
jgi:hypothetical protein